MLTDVISEIDVMRFDGRPNRPLNPRQHEGGHRSMTECNPPSIWTSNSSEILLQYGTWYFFLFLQPLTSGVGSTWSVSALSSIKSLIWMQSRVIQIPIPSISITSIVTRRALKPYCCGEQHHKQFCRCVQNSEGTVRSWRLKVVSVLAYHHKPRNLSVAEKKPSVKHA